MTGLTDEDDWPPVAETGEVAWQRDVARAREGNQELRAALRQFDPARLDETVPGKPYSFYVLFHGVIQHNLYHAGQISLLKKAGR